MLKKNKPFMYDPMLIPRVKQYLEENVHQTYVDVTVMAKELQERYHDYYRKKSGPFRVLVEQAYKTVLHSYGLDSNPSSENECDANSDLELMDENQQSNHMNDTLNALYMNNKAGKTMNTANDGELIDISSDESGDESTKSSKKAEASAAANASPAHVTITKLKPNKSNELSTNKAVKVPLPPIENLPIALQRLQQISKKRKLDSSPANDLGNINQNTKSRKYKREFPITISKVNFSNVGGVEKILKELCELLMHIKHPEVYRHIGLPPPRGFLLHGPPGSGKTLLAQAISGQLEVPLIEVAATELVAGVSGESEERIRMIFEQAAAIAPCVLFIDEVDAISANRINAQKDLERRIVAQLLSSLDGLSKMNNGDQVLVIGATNRADSIDPALRRVGRFDQEICLGIPDRDARGQILRVICEKLKLERPFDFDKLAALTPGFVGADLLALSTRAASIAVKRAFSKKEEESLRRRFSDKNTNSCTIPDIVNLTDDSILMDVDDIAEKEKLTGNGITENGKDMEEIVVDDKEAQIDQAVEIENETEENGNGTEKEKGKEMEQCNIEGNENLLEDEEKDITKKSAEESIPKMMEVVPSTEIIKKPEDTETLADALLNKSALKLQLTLNELVNWLKVENPPISGDEFNDLCITMNDFIEALAIVQPSAKREGFITVPDVTWDDIGSLKDIREELKLTVLAPVKYPKKLEILGLQAPSGVLLCGPPGCGKTLLAKAVANEAGINFISVKGPELLNMYVGESERAVRQCFQRARNSAPCVIFFDEFDSLCPKRSNRSENTAGARVVNQLLTEMDGIEERKGVFLMAATNRPDIVDPAVLRPGRLDKIIYVGLPEQSDRADILDALTKKGTKPTLDADVDLKELASLTPGYTGADLSGLVRQASLQALKESILNDEITMNNDELKVNRDHFLKALQQTKPSVSEEEKKNYEKLRLLYATSNQLNF